MQKRYKALALWSAAILSLLLGLYLRCFVFLKIGPGTIVIFTAIFAAAALANHARKYSAQS